MWGIWVKSSETPASQRPPHHTTQQGKTGATGYFGVPLAATGGLEAASAHGSGLEAASAHDGGLEAASAHDGGLEAASVVAYVRYRTEQVLNSLYSLLTS